jgi:hypothetical protein
MTPLRRCFCLFVAGLILFGTVGVVFASVQSYTVGAGQEVVCKISVSSGDKVHFSFVTAGDESNMLSFSVVFPNSSSKDFGKVGQCSSSFVSNVKGSCDLHFVNNDSSQAVVVTVSYEVEHFIFGMPQMLFLLALITVLLLAVVAGYVIMGKYS